MPSIITAQVNIARLEKQEEEIHRFLETSNLWRIGSSISRSVREYFYVGRKYPSVCVIGETRVTQAVANSKRCQDTLLHFLQEKVDERIIDVRIKFYDYDTGSCACANTGKSRRSPLVFVYFDKDRLEIEF